MSVREEEVRNRYILKGFNWRQLALCTLELYKTNRESLPLMCEEVVVILVARPFPVFHELNSCSGAIGR